MALAVKGAGLKSDGMVLQKPQLESWGYALLYQIIHQKIPVRHIGF